MAFELLRDKPIRCKSSNVMLLKIRITRQFNDFHPVLECRRYGNTSVGSRNKHNIGEVECDIHVMIPESRVLFRIEHFKEGRRRISSEIRTEFINLVKQEQWIFRLDIAEPLNDTSRDCTDIGASVSTDLCFVSNTTERHSNKLPTCGAGN